MPPKKKSAKTKPADDSEAENLGELRQYVKYGRRQQEVKLGSFSR